MSTLNTLLVHQVGPLVHQVGSNPTNDHLFAKISGNHSVSSFLNPKHFVFSSYHELVLPRVFDFSQTQAWIIDTRATNHMISFVSLYTIVTATVSSQVKLPNGQFASVTHWYYQNLRTFNTY
jgi:hypothetical protein